MPGKLYKQRMSNKLVISDTSCLIGLTNIGKLDVLTQLYGTVLVTPEVADEFALTLPEWITVKAVTDSQKTITFNEFIDLGESSAIALATELEDVLVIIDERRARKVALGLGLEIIGTLGLLIRAYDQGFIEDIESTIADLRRTHFRLPDNAESLVKSILK
ncbi:hypothetical protein FACS189483_07840 [Spirochaetia bacterium]|nr:hypothetical protein FACS189483_07840 [Spirochaetia bacterium]